MAVDPVFSVFGLALPPHYAIALQCFAGLIRRQRYSAVALAGLSRTGEDSDGGLPRLRRSLAAIASKT